MTIFNGQWLSVSSPAERGVSFVRLQDIDRVYYGPRGRDSESGFVIAVSSNGNQYSYKTASSEEDAAKMVEEILVLIETAFGRLQNNQQ